MFILMMNSLRMNDRVILELKLAIADDKRITELFLLCFRRLSFYQSVQYVEERYAAKYYYGDHRILLLFMINLRD